MISARIFACACLLTILTSGSPAFGDPEYSGSRWGREYFPNVPLTTHEGQKVNFFDDLVEDKVVVINFIYTTCPDACPLETARLMEVQSILGDRVGRDIFMYSITIDPDHDTPEVLARYAKMYQIGPGWKFLTGDEDDIILIRKKLGLYIDGIREENENNHNLSLMIGNQKTGVWLKRSPFENPYVLASHIGQWLTDWKDPIGLERSYEDAPELRKITNAETIFRTRCSSCHTIGKGDGLPRVGPNLLGVTRRRDHEWLARWIQEPDKMIAERDPIAIGLMVKHDYVQMPNLRLKAKEVEAVIAYLENEDERLGANGEILESEGHAKPCCQKKSTNIVEREEPVVSVAPASVASPPGSGFTYLERVGILYGILAAGMAFLWFLGVFRRKPAVDLRG